MGGAKLNKLIRPKSVRRPSLTSGLGHTFVCSLEVARRIAYKQISSLACQTVGPSAVAMLPSASLRPARAHGQTGFSASTSANELGERANKQAAA